MRASQTRQETRARENIIQGMEAAHGLLSSKSCQILSKKTSFKKFLAFMAEKAPETMGKTLEDILKKMPQPTGNDLTGKGRKRAPDQAARNEARETKKAKLETVRMFGREAIPNEDGERVSKKIFVVHSPLQKSSIDVPFPNFGIEKKRMEQKRDTPKYFPWRAHAIQLSSHALQGRVMVDYYC